MESEKLKTLEYNKIWLEDGILTIDLLNIQFNEYLKGTDKNKEHYRYTTFSNYLQSRPFLSDCQLSSLLDAIQIDPDSSLAHAMALDILKTKSLQKLQFEFVEKNLIQLFGNDMLKYIEREKTWRLKGDQK